MYIKIALKDMGNVRNEWLYVVQCSCFNDITVFLTIHKLLINSYCILIRHM